MKQSEPLPMEKIPPRECPFELVGGKMIYPREIIVMKAGKNVGKSSVKLVD
jgi:hypothetical protein